MKIAFIGHGNVGGALARHMDRVGHEVTIAATNPNSESLKTLIATNPRLKIAAPLDAVNCAEIVVLATPFQANIEVLMPLKDAVAGKLLIDCTNPVGPGLSHGLSSRQSGTEMIQENLPDTKVVKAFSIYGFENLEEPTSFAHDVKPVMMFCGNDTGAKTVVAKLLTELGWEPLDVGGAEQALHLEHLTLLWVRMVRMGGHSPHLVWAALRS